MPVWMPTVVVLLANTLGVVVVVLWNKRVLSSRIELLRTEVRCGRNVPRDEMNVLSAEMRQGFAEFRHEIKKEFSLLRMEMRSEFRGPARPHRAGRETARRNTRLGRLLSLQLGKQVFDQGQSLLE